MKLKMFLGFALVYIIGYQTYAQYKMDDPNLDQIPQYLRESFSTTSDASLSSVTTIGDWDNFSLGVDFAENNMAMNPKQPKWFFTAYNTNSTHHTENGSDWAINNPAFGASMAGDPVVAYDSLGNLFYENMYGSILGCKVISSVTNGLTWGAPVTAIAGNDKNWLACDQTSGPYANYVYTTMTNNGVGNFARSIDHGATFTSTFAPSTQSLPGMMVCVGPQGNVQGGAVYVVTNSGSSFSSVYTFYLSNNGGASFTQKSSQQWSNTVGSQVGGRNSVENMRTRPYPMIAADNSYGANRGKLYCVYASNDPPGALSKPDIFCRTSSDGGTTWGAAIKVNDDPNTQNNHQWHPGIWCDKETGKLYVMWMDTRDTPTSDSAYIYASYSTNGGSSFVANQRISNAKMKIDCPTCGGGGTPRYQGDYNGVVSNKKVSMVGWTDFRLGNFQSMTGYFPDFALAIDHTSDTLYSPTDNTVFQVSIPQVKLYTDTVILSASITPAPTTGTITFEYPGGNVITTYPNTKAVRLVLSGNVPNGSYSVTFIASGPNGTPVHKRSATILVLTGTPSYTQNIALNTGWNLMSFNVQPVNTNFLTILQPMINAGTLIKVIDEAGNIIQYFPWGWTNNIGNMALTEGYYIKVTAPCTLSLTGVAAATPYTIPLSNGWNIMGYPCQNPQNALTGLQPLITSGALLKVFDEAGNIIQNFPWGWVNNIGNMKAGEGYYIKVNVACSITLSNP